MLTEREKQILELYESQSLCRMCLSSALSSGGIMAEKPGRFEQAEHCSRHAESSGAEAFVFIPSDEKGWATVNT